MWNLLAWAARHRGRAILVLVFAVVATTMLGASIARAVGGDRAAGNFQVAWLLVVLAGVVALAVAARRRLQAVYDQFANETLEIVEDERPPSQAVLAAGPFFARHEFEYSGSWQVVAGGRPIGPAGSALYHHVDEAVVAHVTGVTTTFVTALSNGRRIVTSSLVGLPKPNVTQQRVPSGDLTDLVRAHLDGVERSCVDGVERIDPPGGPVAAQLQLSIDEQVVVRQLGVHVARDQMRRLARQGIGTIADGSALIGPNLPDA